jgi:hypothetical protein
MASRIAMLGEQLADAFEAKGVAVRTSLNPGVARDYAVGRAAALGIELPDEVVDLYEWHNGVDDSVGDGDSIVFRDNGFISIEAAIGEFAAIQKYYGVHSTIESDQVDLKTCFPIARFEGAWYVVACGGHLHGQDMQHPVISVFQGVDLFFYSLENMLRTCISWVSHPAWKQHEGVPQGVEMEIWRKHNADIFAS